MHGESKQDTGSIDWRTERLIVVDVLAVRRGRPRERIYRTFRNIEQQRIDDAITRLEIIGVVIVKGRSVHQSRALARIDYLRLIGI
jgi:hypothetical protein